MNYFEKYVSNTLGASGNQTYFISDNTPQKGRVFYKAFVGGEYEYSFLFTNKLDSTFADGSHSQANYECRNWHIIKATAMIVDKKESCLNEPKFKQIQALHFANNEQKYIIPGEIFNSDPVSLTCEKDDYICLEIEFQGTEIPYFEEIIIPTFRYENGKWVENKQTPISCMVGINRSVEKRIGFLGDSITEGIGVPMNSYLHWNACIANIIGEKYSYLNLGIGFGRANDAATKDIWLEKAKKMDAVTVCFGVNDIGHGYSEETIKCNLKSIVDELKRSNVRVILFTIPPFGYEKETKEKWYRINKYIKTELSEIAEIYDICAILCDKEPNDNIAKFGGHPNEEGCMLVARDFVDKISL